MDVLGIIEILESQDNEAAKKVLAVINKMFAPVAADMPEIAKRSINMADALIEQLRK